MGTNYYAKGIDCCICRESDGMHLGKSSVGWKFLLHYHERFYKNWAEMKQWLRSSNLEIYDEYNRKQTIEEFITCVESKQNEKHSHNEVEPNTIRDQAGYEFINHYFS